MTVDGDLGWAGANVCGVCFSAYAGVGAGAGDDTKACLL